MTRKVILNLRIANELVKQGFTIVDVKPSNRIQGGAAFIFEVTPAFNRPLNNLSNRVTPRQPINQQRRDSRCVNERYSTNDNQPKGGRTSCHYRAIRCITYTTTV
jgi:hypothetical protein